MSLISKTIFTFEVLHRTDEPFDDEQHGFDGPFDSALGDALRRSWDGNAVGAVTSQETVEIPDEQVAERLRDLGNDGEFFEDELDEEAQNA